MKHTGYWAQMSRTLPLLLLVLAALAATDGSGQTWRGLVVAPERRCSPYRAGDYSYPQSVEASIVRELGGIYSPYTGQRFASTGETDIEHMVARSEAHDSGLCAADPETRRAFARDLLNLTLASPGLNRGLKGASDAAEWMPQRNRCWFAARVVAVRQHWGLTIDAREAETLEAVLTPCDCGTTTGTGGSHARRLGVTESPRCRVTIRPIRSCRMEMATASCASGAVNRPVPRRLPRSRPGCLMPCGCGTTTGTG